MGTSHDGGAGFFTTKGETMYKYLIQNESEAGRIKVSLVSSTRRFCVCFPMTEKSWDAWIFDMMLRGHIPKCTCTMEHHSEGSVTVDILDTIFSTQLAFVFRRVKPDLLVTSHLDWLTFAAFAKEFAAGRIFIEPRSHSDFKKRQRPTSKKAVLEDWQYQG